jgi:2-polyprenyl-6-methoxyphenol hydroxylase-like FAD-dependent oxidoreductase
MTSASTDNTRPLKVAVAGGSIAGLCAGIALRGIGCEVEIFERNTGSMHGRGAGIVVQDDLVNLMRAHGTPPLPVTTCSHRLLLEPDDGFDGTQSLDPYNSPQKLALMPQRFTSWEAIYQTLRAGFPDEHYHSGSEVTGFHQDDHGVTLNLSRDGHLQSDLLICADGLRSRHRSQLLPDVKTEYAGYVAWRGTLDESRASARLLKAFNNRFVFCAARSGGHILNYLIPGPGPGARTEPGQRQLNWVWYVKVPAGPELEHLLTDRHGRKRDLSVPAGDVPDETRARLHTLARQELHPLFAELVAATEEPFLQSIVDVVVPRMAFGRVCLLGDAAFGIRPHTAAAAAKGAADAAALAKQLQAERHDPDTALQRWQTHQLEVGQRLHRQGVSLGKQITGG